MDYRKVILPIFLGLFILSSFASQAYAIEMTTVVIPTLDEAQAQFTGDGIVTITYDPNSALSKNLTGFDENVKFKANMSTPGMERAGFHDKSSIESKANYRTDSKCHLGLQCTDSWNPRTTENKLLGKA